MLGKEETPRLMNLSRSSDPNIKVRARAVCAARYKTISKRPNPSSLFLGKLPRKISPESRPHNPHPMSTFLLNQLKHLPARICSSAHNPQSAVVAMGIPSQHAFRRFTARKSRDRHIRVLDLCYVAVRLRCSCIRWLALPVWRIGAQVVGYGGHGADVGEGAWDAGDAG